MGSRRLGRCKPRLLSLHPIPNDMHRKDDLFRLSHSLNRETASRSMHSMHGQACVLLKNATCYIARNAPAIRHVIVLIQQVMIRLARSWGEPVHTTLFVLLFLLLLSLLLCIIVVCCVSL